MYIIINHEIKDVAGFWASAQESLPNLPAGIKIHSVFPNATMDRATCLWEADSMEQMRNYLEEKTGHIATNHYMEVDTAHAMGLPG